MAATAHQALDTVAVRTFAALRTLNVALLVGYLLVWHTWYAAHPAGLAAAAVTATWGVVFVATAMSSGRLHRPVVAGNVAVAICLNLGAVLCVPAQSVAGAGTWIFSASTHAALVAAWAYSRRALTTVVATLVLATLIGAVVGQITVDHPASGGNPAPLPRALAGSLMLIGVAVLFRFAISRLRAAAVEADTRLGTAADQRRDAAVASARLRDERERERLLHDTVLNTLTGIAWGGGSQDPSESTLTADQCRYAIDAVRTMLDGTAAATRDLTESVLRVVSVARAHGLRVDVESLPATDLPEEVVRALAGATQELLANVRRHARTDHATLAVSHLPGGVEVVVADGGRGFAVQEVPDDRLGLARSVHARLAEVGGRATITSGDGLGTTARLTWSAAASATAGSATAGSATAGTAADGTAPGLAEAARPADPRPTGTAGTAGGAARRRPGAGAATRRRRVHRRGPATVPAGRSAAELRDSYAAALRRATAVGAAAWFSCTVVVLLVTLPGSRSVPLAVLCWLAMALLVAAAAITTHRRSLRSGEAAALMTLALAVTVVVGLNSAAAPGSPGAGGPASRIATWPVFVLPVLLALVAVSRLFVEWLAALVATVVVLGLLVLTGTNPGTFALAQLLAATNGQVALQLTVSMAGPVLRRTADQVARAIEQETARTALERSAQAVRADRERGLATIEREVLPLLEAVADGLLDPRDRAVRERCGSRATAIRQALVAGAAGGLGELAPAVVEARSRGLEVEVRLDGETRRIPPPVLERLVGVLPTLLGEASAAGAGRVVLTLIHDDAGGRLFLTYPADDPPAGDTLVGVPAGPAGSELVSVTADVDEGQVWIEVAWSAADRRTGTP